ncbi:hypothetical protein Tco_1171272 [Tanacetum coccineum]
MRVRAMASSSRLYNTRCFQYDKRDSEDVCILKCDSKPRSVAHHAVNYVFDPRVSPTNNLLRLLNLADYSNGLKYKTYKIVWWNVEEDNKALCLLRAMTGDQSKEYPPARFTESEESVEHDEFMFAIHPTNDTESVREENMASLLHAMRQSEMKQTNSEPSVRENSPDSLNQKALQCAGSQEALNEWGMENNNSEEEERREHSNSWRKFVIFSHEKKYANQPSGAPHRIMSLLQHIKANLENFAESYMIYVDALMIFEVV